MVATLCVENNDIVHDDEKRRRGVRKIDSHHGPVHFFVPVVAMTQVDTVIMRLRCSQCTEKRKQKYVIIILIVSTRVVLNMTHNTS